MIGGTGPNASANGCALWLSFIRKMGNPSVEAPHPIGPKRLKDNCMTPVVAARKGLKTDEQKMEVKKLEEEAIFSAGDHVSRTACQSSLYVESAIQDFLAVKWADCKWDDADAPEEIDENTGQVKKKKKKRVGDTRISELFWGPKARQDEGIRSGVR